MLSVGETLKRARLEQRLDLCTVAAQTKISVKYLEAIESDDRKKLPSGFFYRSFVEQYAKYFVAGHAGDRCRSRSRVKCRRTSAIAWFRKRGGAKCSADDIRTPLSHTTVLHIGRQPWCWCWSAVREFYAWWHDARSSISVKGMMDRARVAVSGKDRDCAQASIQAAPDSTKPFRVFTRSRRDHAARSVPCRANVPVSLASELHPATK